MGCLFYDGLKVVAEGTGQNDKIYYTNSPGVIGGIVCRDNNGTKLWYHYDRLGTPVAVTDANGGVAAVYQNTAFGYGEWAYGSSGFNQMITDPQPYHLTTKEFDANVGLYYFNARWYDATTARFVSRDSVRRGEPYLYCNSAPNCVDPTGRYCCRSAGGKAAADAFYDKCVKDAKAHLDDMSFLWGQWRDEMQAANEAVLRDDKADCDKRYPFTDVLSNLKKAGCYFAAEASASYRWSLWWGTYLAGIGLATGEYIATLNACDVVAQRICLKYDGLPDDPAFYDPWYWIPSI